MPKDVVSTLKKLEKFVEQNSQQGDRPKAKWLTLKDSETVKINFLQELDPDSKSYNEDAGEVLVLVEHANPESFRTKAECTIDDEGKCFGCEKYREDPVKNKSWKGRARLYANVLVSGHGIEDPYVAILSQGISSKSISPILIMTANDNGSISNLAFRMKRTGSDFNNTSYALVPVMGSEGVDVKEYLDQMYDLRATVTRHVPYAEQKEFYLGSEASSDVEAASPAQAAAEW